jgi:hypothetical protein
MTNDLDPDDRAFLKEVIFIINNTRDPNIVDKKFIEEHIDDNPNYLWVPLEKASKSTRWTNPSKYFEDFGRRVANYCKNPMLFFREMYEGILTDEEQNVINTDIENL